MATIKDVSRLANVSISTVSRVINNTAQVAPEKREAVLNAMKELNFRPNSFAQALVSKRSNCIGVLVGDLCGGPFFAQMMLGIEQVVDRVNKFSIVITGNHDEHRERHAIDTLLQRQCDALILHAMALPDEELAELVKRDTLWCSSIGWSKVPKTDPSGLIMPKAAGVAVRHLVEQGHSRIAFITSDDQSFVDAQQRFAGYRQGLEDAGLPFDESLVVKAYPR